MLVSGLGAHVTLFFAQLAALCRIERTRAEGVIVPTHTLGHTLGERLALAGRSWTVSAGAPAPTRSYGRRP
jgi:hypothetical protein